MAGEPLDYYTMFDFVVEMDGISAAGFRKCSELSAQLGVVELREGGRNIPHKKPGLLSFPDVTLERGATDNLDLYEWFLECAKAAANSGGKIDAIKRELDIVVLDRDSSERRRYTLRGAWPRTYTAGEWDASSEEAVVEKVVLAYDYFEQTA